jgi:CubicO group peptidase (beta-lactamase class C family)
MLLISFIVVLGLMIAPLSAQEAVYFPTTEWRTSTPEAQGMDSAELANLLAQFSQSPHHPHSIMVVRHGYVVAEAYATPFEADMTHQLWSVSKSVTGGLVGILLRDGYLDSLDVPVLSFFPDRTFDNVDARKEAITLRHLLTMTSGLECDVFLPGYPGDGIFASDDWLQYSLSLPMMADPGTEFHYCNINTYLLSVILTELTGMPAVDFAAEHLFAPLGITDFRWETSPQGVSMGFSGLHLNTGDLAKLGYLYLNGGMWEGEQIIPAEYVAESIGAAVDSGWPAAAYGYFWWNIVPAGTTMMLGRSGIYVILAPDKDLMLVMTGGGITEAVRPAMQGYPLNFAVGALTAADEALPENAEALAQLEAQIARIANPEPVAVDPLPETAAQIDGRVFGLAAPFTLPVEGAAGTTWRQPIAVSRVSFAFPDDEHVNVTLNTVSGDSISVTAAFNGLDAVTDTPFGLLASHAQWRADNELSVWMDYLDEGHLVRLNARFLPGMLQVEVVEFTGGTADFSPGMMLTQ